MIPISPIMEIQIKLNLKALLLIDPLLLVCLLIKKPNIFSLIRFITFFK